VLLGVRSVAIGYAFTLNGTEYVEFVVSGTFALSVTITLATNVPIALVVQTNDSELDDDETVFVAIIFDGLSSFETMKVQVYGVVPPLTDAVIVIGWPSSSSVFEIIIVALTIGSVGLVNVLMLLTPV